MLNRSIGQLISCASSAAGIRSLTKNAFKPQTFSLPLAGLLSGLLIACSSGDDPDSSQRQGFFVDSAVSGLDYATDTIAGKTGMAGEFSYQAGESIRFSIGALQLPAISAADLVTPLTVFDARNINDTRSINLSRLLQSLDTDGNPENGIEISPLAAASAPSSVDFSSLAFDQEVANLVANSGSITTSLIDADSAKSHLQQTLENNGLGPSGCGTDHPMVGKTAMFENFFHGIAGQVRIVDNCTIDITGFSYDGGGPLVYFYAANNRAYESADAFIIGPLLSGTVFNNDQFRLLLPDDKTLDDLNGISVWCQAVQVNFGDAFFGEQAP